MDFLSYDIIYYDENIDIDFLNKYSKKFMLQIYEKKNKSIQSLITYKLLLSLLQKHFKDENLILPKINYNNHNKPMFFEDGFENINFNISHTKNASAAVISNFHCGIDIEYISNINFNITKKICNENDFIYLDSFEDKNQGLLNIWTIKEAVSKAIGLGFSVGFKNIHINYSSSLAQVNNVQVSFFKVNNCKNFNITIAKI